VSYALKLAIEVRQALRELPIDVQEHVLDLFDQVASDPVPADPSDWPRVAIHHAAYAGDEIVILRFGIVTDDTSLTMLVRRMRYVLVR
jgi:hypothetical protein